MSNQPFLVSLHRNWWWTIGALIPLGSVALGLFLMWGQIIEKRGNPKSDTNPLGWFATCVAVGAMLGTFAKVVLDRAKDASDKADKAAERLAEQLKQEEERKEVVSYTLCAANSIYLGLQTVGLRLYNSGRCAVNVESVHLFVTLKGEKTRVRFYRDGELIKFQNGSGGFHQQVPTMALEHKQDVLYKLDNDFVHDLRKMSELSLDEVFAEVRSFEGPLLKIEGAELNDILRKVWSHNTRQAQLRS